MPPPLASLSLYIVPPKPSNSHKTKVSDKKKIYREFFRENSEEKFLRTWLRRPAARGEFLAHYSSTKVRKINPKPFSIRFRASFVSNPKSTFRSIEIQSGNPSESISFKTVSLRYKTLKSNELFCFWYVEIFLRIFGI